MRRSLAALLCLLALAAIVAGCGATTNGAAPGQASAEAPAPGDLAAEALAALDEAKSAHYELDLTVELDPAEGAGPGAAAVASQPIEVHVEGDGSSDAASADVAVEAMGQRFAATILAGQRKLFVNFLGTWYGGDLSRWAKKTRRPRRELATPPRVREHFEDVFTGTVETGPPLEGQETWSYAGTLDASGLVQLAERYGEKLSAEEREQLESLARTVELRFLVGKEDNLPRRLELDLRLGENALRRSFAPLDGVQATLVVQLSEFGKAVELDPPAEYRPLKELSEQFFGL